MRAFLLVAFFGLAASVSDSEIGQCMVDGGEAVNDAADAAMFIWASVKRCGKAGLEIKCEVDVSSAAESVNSMINIILKALDKCGNLKDANKDCGMAAGLLTEHTAGLAAAAGDLVQKCPNAKGAMEKLVAHKQAAGPAFGHSIALCMVNMKDTAKSLFKLTQEFQTVDKNCGGSPSDSKPCLSNAFRLVGGFAAIGEFLAGAVGHCSKVPQHHEDALCAQASEMVVHHSMKVSAAATDLAIKCAQGSGPSGLRNPTSGVASQRGGSPPTEVVIEEQVPRLYEMNGQGQSAGFANMVLGAFLPVTAIVGFAAGRVYGRRATQHQSRQLPLSDTEVEI